MRSLVLFIAALIALGTCAQKDGMAKREAKVRTQLAKGRSYKAISLCNGALGLEKRPVFYVLRADAHNRLGEHMTAERDARTGLASLPGDREALLQLAIAQQGLGKSDSALALYRALLSTKSDPDIRYRLANTLRSKGDHPGALLELDRLLDSLPEGDPMVPKVLRSRGESQALTADTAAARATFQRALDLVPNDPVILNSRAWFLYAAYGDHTKAIVDYDRAIRHNPNYSYAFNNRGWSKYKNGDTYGALRDINLAKKKKAFNPYIYRNLGVIALEQGDRTEACSQFRRALDLNFTAVFGPEVQRLADEQCQGQRPELKPNAPSNAPGEQKPTPPPTRTNAPE